MENSIVIQPKEGENIKYVPVSSKWVQPEEGENIKYVPVSDEEMEEAYNIAVKMIENGQTKFIIDASQSNSSETTNT